MRQFASERVRCRLVGLVLAGSLALCQAKTSAGDYVVGVEATDYLPIYGVQGGEYRGFSRELLDQFAAHYGHHFTYEPLPVPRLFDDFLRRQVLDFKFPDNPDWHTELKTNIAVLYSNPVLVVSEGLLVPAAKAGQLQGTVRTLSTIRGFTPFPYLDAIKSGKITVLEANTAQAALRMTTTGHTDGSYLNTAVANYLLRNVLNQPGSLVLDKSLPFTHAEFKLATIRHPDVLRQLNEYLTMHHADVEALRQKYHVVE